jgi:hypothetical protein
VSAAVWDAEYGDGSPLPSDAQLASRVRPIHVMDSSLRARFGGHRISSARFPTRMTGVLASAT